MHNIKEFLLFYLHHFYLIDYLFFALLAIVFILFLFFAFLLRTRPIIALCVIVFDFIACFLLFYYGYAFIDSKMRARSAEIISQKIYTNSALVIDFNLTNLSSKDFTYCRVDFDLYKNSDDKESTISKYQKHYFPFIKKSKILDQNLSSKETQIQRISFENFGNDNNFSVKIKSECF